MLIVQIYSVNQNMDVSQGNKHKQISDRLRDAQSRRRIQKAEVDLINQKRDTRVAEINALQLEFEVHRNAFSVVSALSSFFAHLVFLHALFMSPLCRRSGRENSHSWSQNNRGCVRSCETSASTNSHVGDKCLLSLHADIRLVTGHSLVSHVSDL